MTLLGRFRPGALGAVALLAVLASCALEDGSDIGPADAGSTSSAPPVAAAPEPDAPPGAGGPLGYDEGDCPFDPGDVDVTCGTLVVPRDRSDADEGTVSVAVARLHATGRDPRPDPVLYFEGGPGGASLTYTDWWSTHPLLRERDIILFDQRGTGYSEPNLSCDAEFGAADVDDEAGDVGLYEACYDRLAATTDLSDFTTTESAHDVADLVAALGLEDVNFLGISYGTRLAMVTMGIAPESVRSVVLDSVYPPGVEALDLLAPNGASALDEVYTACDADADCRALTPALDRTLREAVTRLDAEPVEVQLVDAYTGEREPVDAYGTDLVDAVFSALYDNLVIVDVPRAIVLASSGDQDDVQAAFDLLYDEEPERKAMAIRGTDPPDESDGLYYSVTCSEEMPMTTLAEVRDASDGVDPALRDDLLSSAEYDIDVCKVWDAGQATAEPLRPVTSALPTLLLSGRFDPITPPFWAQEAAERLSNSYAYVLDGVGHGVMDSHVCGLDLVRSFLDDPTSAPDSSCVADADPPHFTVD